MSHSSVRRLSTAIAATAIILTAGASAGQRSETEREVLARAIVELDLISSVIADAERRVDPEARIYFDYRLLRAEILELRSGISEYVEGDRLQPRSIDPLAADYVRYRGAGER